jgi:hypothetical protein
VLSTLCIIDGFTVFTSYHCNKIPHTGYLWSTEFCSGSWFWRFKSKSGQPHWFVPLIRVAHNGRTACWSHREPRSKETRVPLGTHPQKPKDPPPGPSLLILPLWGPSCYTWTFGNTVHIQTTVITIQMNGVTDTKDLSTWFHITAFDSVDK